MAYTIDIGSQTKIHEKENILKNFLKEQEHRKMSDDFQVF